jgi:hypothetical protein
MHSLRLGYKPEFDEPRHPTFPRQSEIKTFGERLGDFGQFLVHLVRPTPETNSLKPEPIEQVAFQTGSLAIVQAELEPPEQAIA